MEFKLELLYDFSLELLLAAEAFDSLLMMLLDLLLFVRLKNSLATWDSLTSETVPNLEACPSSNALTKAVAFGEI